MALNPYIFFNGQCEEAFKFYEKTLGGKIVVIMPHEGTPAEQNVPAEWRKKVMHARIDIGNQTLLASDAPPEHYRKPQGFSLCVDFKQPEEAERVFAELSKGGHVNMPIQETFWAQRFGMLVDRFDIPWMVNCEKPRQ